MSINYEFGSLLHLNGRVRLTRKFVNQFIVGNEIKYILVFSTFWFEMHNTPYPS